MSDDIQRKVAQLKQKFHLTGIYSPGEYWKGYEAALDDMLYPSLPELLQRMHNILQEIERLQALRSQHSWFMKIRPEDAIRDKEKVAMTATEVIEENFRRAGIISRDELERGMMIPEEARVEILDGVLRISRVAAKPIQKNQILAESDLVPLNTENTSDKPYHSAVPAEALPNSRGRYAWLGSIVQNRQHAAGVSPFLPMCEYNPETGKEMLVGESTHQVKVEWDLGNGKWQLCSSCAALPQFENFRLRKKIPHTD